ncbi:hypothetical protein N1F89_03985 [Aquibium sp. A9E412]|uniref:hypothetical protein n=1 Tax=Aquibium sp. A9E412 TaxID=2976767 RepID=UPI0025B2151B|nr:hypothetical protein [Aquibium sp. A9E412]MDN2565371.1 hypothetical protein [Aquibium sp. A9E412]
MLDAANTRRLAIGLLTAAGALLFAALQLVGAGVSAGNLEYAAGVSRALSPLAASGLAGIIALVFAEIADYPGTPEDGHPHGRINYLQSAFVVIGVWGLGTLIWGGVELLVNAMVLQP